MVFKKGHKHSKETKRKIGKSNKISQKGKKLSEEHKKKISNSLKGRIPWNKNKKLPKSYRKNISQSLIGNKRGKGNKSKLGQRLSRKTKKKISASHQGISLKEWKKFVSFEPYTPKFNKEFKNLIRLRDNFCCLDCGISEQRHLLITGRRLSIHHIDYDKKNTYIQNCCTLCNKCNIRANKFRKYWTNYFRDLLSEKYGYQYQLNENTVKSVLEIKNRS